MGVPSCIVALPRGLWKEKLAFHGCCISSTFPRMAPAAWVGDGRTGHLPSHPLPQVLCGTAANPPKMACLPLASVLQLGQSPWHNTKGDVVRVGKLLKLKTALTGQILETCLWNVLITLHEAALGTSTLYGLGATVRCEDTQEEMSICFPS